MAHVRLDKISKKFGSHTALNNLDLDIADGQFFVLLGDAPSLSTSGVYNHFGTVSSGAEVVGSIQVGDTIRTIDVATQ